MNGSDETILHTYAMDSKPGDSTANSSREEYGFYTTYMVGSTREEAYRRSCSPEVSVYCALKEGKWPSEEMIINLLNNHEDWHKPVSEFLIAAFSPGGFLADIHQKADVCIERILKDLQWTVVDLLESSSFFLRWTLYEEEILKVSIIVLFPPELYEHELNGICLQGGYVEKAEEFIQGISEKNLVTVVEVV